VFGGTDVLFHYVLRLMLRISERTPRRLIESLKQGYDWRSCARSEAASSSSTACCSSTSRRSPRPLELIRGEEGRKPFASGSLTNLGRELDIGDFDVSAEGREIPFDRAREESDIIVFVLPVRNALGLGTVNGGLGGGG
jgi:hypothetical protein